MNTDTRKQIETALGSFSGSDLRTASIGLFNSLGRFLSPTKEGAMFTPPAQLNVFDFLLNRGEIFPISLALYAPCFLFHWGALRYALCFTKAGGSRSLRVWNNCQESRFDPRRQGYQRNRPHVPKTDCCRAAVRPGFCDPRQAEAGHGVIRFRTHHLACHQIRGNSWLTSKH